MILKQHKLEIVKVIQRLGLTINDFKIEEGPMHFKLMPLGTGSDIHFTFTLAKTDDYHTYKCQFLPFAPQAVVAKPLDQGNIHHIITHMFDNWIRDHAKVYLENERAHDPWGSINQQFFQSAGSEESKDEFTIEQKSKIRKALREEFRTELISQFRLTSGQIKILDEKIDHMDINLDKLSKQDWTSYVYGTLTSIAINLSFDHSQGIQLMELFVNAFRDLKPFNLFFP